MELNLDNLTTDYDMSIIDDAGISISTISTCCSFEHSSINLKEFFKNIIIDENNIKNASYGDNTKPITKKKKRSFFNQITLEIFSPYKYKINQETNIKKIDKGVNIKIFKNGSIQMCGIKCIDDCKYILEYVIKYIKKNDLIINDNKELKIINFKLSLINCKIDVKYNIKREKLYEILKDTEYPAIYSPCIHAAVKIKSFPDNDNPIPILIFQSGSIIILTKTIENVIKGHELITNILSKYKDQIIRIDNKDLLDLLLK